ncbi:MAG: tetratricopeptide repeat protein, partial [Planctomycetales bacterium]
ADLNKAIEIQPRYYGAVGDRGLVKRALGDHQGAARDFTLAANRDRSGEQHVYYVNRGLSKVQLGEIEGALADVDTAIRRQPKEWSYYCVRALIKEKLKDKNGALADYAMAAKFASRSAQSFAKDRVAEIESGDPSDISEDFNELLRSGPENPFVFHSRSMVQPNPNGLATDVGSSFSDKAFEYLSQANALILQGELKEALARCDKAVLESPRQGTAYRVRAVVKRRLGDLSGAKADQTRAVELNPDEQEVYNARAIIHWLQGDLDAAVKDLDQSLQIRKDQPETRYRRALIFQQQGKYDQALREYLQLVKIAEKPTQDSASLRIWLLRTREGKPRIAAKVLQDHFGDRLADAKDWNACLAKFFLAEANPEDLLDLCRAETSEETKNRRGEAYQHAALRSLVEGRRDQAEEFFRKSVQATGDNGTESDFESAARLKT